MINLTGCGSISTFAISSSSQLNSSDKLRALLKLRIDVPGNFSFFIMQMKRLIRQFRPLWPITQYVFIIGFELNSTIFIHLQPSIKLRHVLRKSPLKPTFTDSTNDSQELVICVEQTIYLLTRVRIICLDSGN